MTPGAARFQNPVKKKKRKNTARLRKNTARLRKISQKYEKRPKTRGRFQQTETGPKRRGETTGKGRNG
jgi:hypothetical protein